MPFNAFLTTHTLPTKTHTHLPSVFSYEDASECVAVSPSNVKGLFRKGVSLHAMGQWKEACEVLTECLRLEPGNKQAKQARQFAEVKLQMDMRKRMGA